MCQRIVCTDPGITMQHHLPAGMAGEGVPSMIRQFPRTELGHRLEPCAHIGDEAVALIYGDVSVQGIGRPPVGQPR